MQFPDGIDDPDHSSTASDRDASDGRRPHRGHPGITPLESPIAEQEPSVFAIDRQVDPAARGRFHAGRLDPPSLVDDHDLATGSVGDRPGFVEPIDLCFESPDHGRFGRSGLKIARPTPGQEGKQEHTGHEVASLALHHFTR